jgi:molybdenum cofactor cytidylyltransferase
MPSDSTRLTYNPTMVPAVVLAAGRSTRMGRTKALLPIGADGGETFLTRIVRTFRAAGVDETIVVLGHDADAVAECLAKARLSPRIVLNPHYDSGQLSSVLAGLNAIDHPGVSAMLLTLVDVPFASVPTIVAVLERYRTTGAPIVRPVHGSAHGHPVIIDRGLFGAVRRADATLGIKPIVRAHVSARGDVEVDDEGAFLDIDTPDDYARAIDAKLFR